VILAAGKGTRMKSGRPKVLHHALGLPLLEHVLRAVEALSLQPVTVVAGHQAEAVEAAFADRGLTFVRQEPPLGTGHALQCARDHFAEYPDRTLLVVNGDLPLLRAETLASLLKLHHASRAAATLLTVVLPDPGAYGRVLRGTDGRRKRAHDHECTENESTFHACLLIAGGPECERDRERARL